MARLGSKMPYREAVDELKRMWGVTVSHTAVKTQTDDSGRILVALNEVEVSRLQREVPRPEATPAKLTLSVDGSMVPLINGEWREVKMMIIGEHQLTWNARRSRLETSLKRISYAAQMATATEFAEHCLPEWHRRGGENATEVVAVTDGATWIQPFISYHRPDAVRIIDFCHAVGYLAEVGRALHGEGTAACEEWFQKARRRLRSKPPEETLAALHLLRRQHDDEGEVATAIDRALGYLSHRVAMIDYKHFRRCGYPIGSGSVESAHKVVMQRRMKQAGMRWAPDSVNPMLALRTLHANERWDEGWQVLTAQRRAAQRHTRLKLTRPPEPPPPLTLDALPVAAPAELVTADSAPATPSAPLAHETSSKPRYKPASNHPWRNNIWPERYR